MHDHPSLQELIPSLAPYLNGEEGPDNPDSTESPSDVGPSASHPVSVSPDSSLIPHPSSLPQSVSLSPDSSLIPHPSSFPQTGPRTPDGKSVSRLNSLKHGLDATDRVFMSRLNENEREAYQQIRRALRKFYGCADTAYEFMLIDRMAIQHLRMLRLYSLESEAMDTTPRPGDKWSVIPHLDRFSRYDVRIEKQLRILHNRLLSVFEQNSSQTYKPFTSME